MVLRHFRAMLQDERGATLVEYALVLSILSCISIAGFAVVAVQLYKNFNGATVSASAAASYFTMPLPGGTNYR